MKYISEFRDGAASAALVRQIHDIAGQGLAGRTIKIMEVCGTHTMSIGRFGIRAQLPPSIDLVSGPGCPVCVTDEGYIDCALELARDSKIICTFGDLLKVPGSTSTLAEARAEGARVEVCFSPLDALRIAREEPSREVVFLGVGFETTIAPIVSVLATAAQQDIPNFSLLTAFKIVPPALDILGSDPELKIDAFLCPAHVSAIIGADAYRPFVERHRKPAVIAGFEPVDILLGLSRILRQIALDAPAVENCYSRVVRPEGNRKALALIEAHTKVADVSWRGLGVLPASGLVIRDEFLTFDAASRFGLTITQGKPRAGCKCGDVLKGVIKPPQCALFGRGCTPGTPVGPCMVSSEGTCAAYYRYSGVPAHD